MKEVERGMVFQNLTEQAEMLYVEVGICDHKYRPQIVTTNNGYRINKLSTAEFFISLSELKMAYFILQY